MLKKIILMALLVPNLVFAQTVKLVVPWGPGGGNDTAGRMLARHLNEIGSTKYIVENRPGAGGSLGTTHVVQSRPDGRTLLVNEITGLVFSTAEQANPPYDWQTDLVPVAYLGTMLPMILVVNSQSNIQNIRDLVDRAKTKPLSYGSPGQGTAQHIFGAMLGEITRTQMTHVPYKGQPQVTQDLLSGQIDFAFSPQLTVLPFIEAGRFTALAMAGDHSFGTIPSITSLGYMQFANRDRFYGVWAPAGTPPDVIKELRSTIHQLMNGALKEDLVKASVISPKSTPPTDLSKEQLRIANSYKQIYRDYNIRQ